MTKPLDERWIKRKCANLKCRFTISRMPYRSLHPYICLGCVANSRRK